MKLAGTAWTLRAMSSWTFLTNHAHVLICIMQNPRIRLNDIAEAVGVTERTASAIVADLVAAGYVTKIRQGRRNEYEVHPAQPFRHPAAQQTEIGALLSVFARDEAP